MGEPVLTANRGNPHWLPDGKYGWNGNLFTGLYRFRRETGQVNEGSHYSRILLSVGDQITVERIEAMIGDLQAQKATRHPEQKQ
jgi:hypothetical protein